MKLTEHLEFVINLVERRESSAKIKSSLVAMTEEVSGYEQATTNAIQLSEKQPTPEKLHAEEILARLIELQNAVGELKKQLEDIKNKPPAPARWS